jgi:hypothetical protein
MGDHNSLSAMMRLPSWSHPQDVESSASALLKRQSLNLQEGTLSFILDHVDYFVSQSRGNKLVRFLNLYPYSFNGHNDEVWEKVGQVIGNLQAIDRVSIFPYDSGTYGDHDVNDQVPPNPDWRELVRILSQMRQKLQIDLYTSNLWAAAEVQALARAIRGHPTITSFHSFYNFPYESMNSLYSALATLPALESIKLSVPPADETTLANHESLTELLRVPSLRSVYFDHINFTPDLCHAMAKAFMEGTSVTELNFSRSCSISAGECDAIMANGLARNTSVSCIRVDWSSDRAPFEAMMVAALPSNVTLRHLSFSKLRQIRVESDDEPGARIDWSPLLLALGKNTGLKTLKIDYFDLMNEPLCIAMKDGLGLNKTLESLELTNVVMCDDNAALWCRALSFLRTNKILKSLVVQVGRGSTESCVSALRIGIVAMLEENASLETLSFNGSGTAEEYVALIASLQQNTTLKILQIESYGPRLRLTGEEDKNMAAILKKNYALESLPKMFSQGDVDAILLLNAAGRRYLIEDGSSVSKGVGVLSAVCNNINCVFLHLLENPNLCDRSAVEMASDSTDESRGSAHSGKREHGQAPEESKESRRRLA